MRTNWYEGGIFTYVVIRSQGKKIKETNGLEESTNDGDNGVLNRPL